MYILILILLSSGIIFTVHHFWKKSTNSADRIAIVSIGVSAFMAIILAFISIKVSFYIGSQQLDIRGFGSLLSKSDSTLNSLKVEVDLLRNQLKLNELAQNVANKNAEYADKANMNEFASAVFKLGDKLGKRGIFVNGDEMARHFLVVDFKTILESQVNNPFVVKNDTIADAWMSAYKQIYYYSDGWSITNHNKEDFNSNFIKHKRNDTIMDKTVDVKSRSNKQEVGMLWDKVNRAYELGVAYLKGDGRFQAYR